MTGLKDRGGKARLMTGHNTIILLEDTFIHIFKDFHSYYSENIVEYKIFHCYMKDRAFKLHIEINSENRFFDVTLAPTT